MPKRDVVREFRTLLNVLRAPERGVPREAPFDGESVREPGMDGVLSGPRKPRLQARAAAPDAQTGVRAQQNRRRVVRISSAVAASPPVAGDGAVAHPCGVERRDVRTAFPHSGKADRAEGSGVAASSAGHDFLPGDSPGARLAAPVALPAPWASLPDFRLPMVG